MKKTLLLSVAVLLGSMGFAQVDCNIANMQGGIAGGFLNWVPGDEALTAFIDPADDYAVGESCGATYPYTIESVGFSLAAAPAFGPEAGDGIGSFSYQIGIYDISGADPCNAPGALLATSGPIDVEMDGTPQTPQMIAFDLEVNDAFFVSFEPLSWTGEVDQTPTILWDATTIPECVQYYTNDNGETWFDWTLVLEGEGWADFNIFGSSESSSGEECEAGTIEDTTPLTLCPDEEGVFSVGGTQEIPFGHSYALFFNPTTGTGGPGGAFNLTGVSLPFTIDAELGGLFTGTPPPMEGEWEIYGRVYENPDSVGTTTCSETESFILVDFLTASDPECQGGGDEPCEDYAAGPWTDLNTAWDGAPCDDGEGCPFLEFTDFEVFESEAYVMDDIQMDGSYTFSHCNGPGAGSWIPEYTIIAPSGAVDAYGAGDGDGCSITWTASEDGTYLIVINEAGACGVGGSTPNGYPAMTCNGDNVDCEPVVVPENDDCANAETVVPGVHDFTTDDATTDGPDQPGSDCDNAGETNVNQDVWYEYTAGCTGIGSVSTCNTADFDTRIAIYPGGTCPTDGGALIACNDDGFDSEGVSCTGFTSLVEWDITEGTTYLIRIGGFDNTESGSGTFDLVEDCATSVNDEPTANFSVFPNPNNGQFALEYAGQSGLAQIDVMDVSGKAVYSEQQMMTEGTRLDIDLGNVNGLYFVRMTMNQNTKILKVIVQ